MRRKKVAPDIEYVQPSAADITGRSSCSGIILHTRPKVMIDINLGSENTLRLLEREEPDIALVTHYHLDHTLMTGIIHDHTDTEIFLPASEEHYFTDIETMVNGATTSENTDIRERWRQLILTSGYQELQRYTLYDEQTDFGLVPSGYLQAIPTPGHSPGHHSFYFPQYRILLAGDIGLDKFGPWYGGPDCDIVAYIESILRLMELEMVLVLTSHGGMISRNIERAMAKTLKSFFQHEKTIIQGLESGLTPAQIIDRGIMYPDKSAYIEPLRSLSRFYDEVVFQHHRQILDCGGLDRCFPGLADTLP